MHSTGPSWKCAHDTELDQSFSELVGSPPGNENSKSYELRRSSWGKQGGPPQEGAWGYWEYRSVLLVGFYNILPLPGVPLHPVWTGPVRDVVQLMQPNSEVFLQMFFDNLIKLIELYKVVEKTF